MRRFVSVLVCAVLLLTSCGSKKSSSPVTSGFRCTADITYNGASVQAVLDRTDTTKTTLEFTSPTELVGLSMVYENGTLSARYAGFHVQIDESAVPVANAAKLINDTLTYIAAHSETMASEYSFDGAVVQLDSDTGLPIKMEISACDFVVVFSEWESSGIQY